MPRRKTTNSKKRQRYEEDDDYAPSTSVHITKCRKRSGQVDAESGDLHSEKKNKPRYVQRQDSLGSEDIELSKEPIYSYKKENSEESTIIDIENSPIPIDMDTSQQEKISEPSEISKAASANEPFEYVDEPPIPGEDGLPDVQFIQSDLVILDDKDDTAATTLTPLPSNRGESETVPNKDDELNSSSDASINLSDLSSESTQKVVAIQLERRMEKIDRKSAILRAKKRADAELRVLEMEARLALRLTEIKKKQEQIKVEQSLKELEWIKNEKKAKLFDKYVKKCAQKGILPTVQKP